MMPGPAPKPADQRRRRNAPLANTVKLPAEGRTGDAPEWPLPWQRVVEAKIWADLWATPQAAAWERMGTATVRVVARYVRLLSLVEGPADDEDRAPRTSATLLLGEVRQLEDRLGLTPMAMLRLRWEIVADDLAEKREGSAPTRRRLKAVDPHAPTPEG